MTRQAKATKAAPAPAPARESKIARVTTLLQRKEGATLAEMIEATGWLPPHHARGPHRPQEEGPHDRAQQAQRCDLLPHREERLSMAALDDELLALERLTPGAVSAYLRLRPKSRQAGHGPGAGGLLLE
jgi:hypothetical protein